jgi:hypothetical protein
MSSGPPVPVAFWDHEGCTILSGYISNKNCLSGYVENSCANVSCYCDAEQDPTEQESRITSKVSKS